MPSKSYLMIVSVAVTAALLGAACGGSSSSESEVASDPEPATSSDEVATLEAATPTADVAGAELTDEEVADLWDTAILDFSECVRAEGITDFPDLDGSRIVDTESFVQELSAGGVDIQDPSVGEAMFNCQDTISDVVPLVQPTTPEDDAAIEEAWLAITACVRDNGYPDVPDLDLSDGVSANLIVQLIPYVDVTDPAFQDVAGQCIAESPVDFEGRDTFAELLQS